MRKGVFLLLIVISMSFASLLWTVNTDGPVSTKPVLFDGNIIIASEDGYVYYVSASSGTVIWSRELGGILRQPVIFENQILVANESALFTLSKDGTVKLFSNGFDYIYGTTSGAKLFLTSNDGVFILDGKGAKKRIYNSTGIYTPPATNGNYVVFGYNETLVALKADGTEEWIKEVGSVWKGEPAISEGVVYLGTLDNNLYAVDLSDGFTKWKVATEGWIMSTPYVSDYVYFGSNDGKIYAVEKNLGRITWAAKTGEAVQSTGTIGTLAGRNVLFIGSQDGNLYAIDTSDGTVVLKYPTKSWAHSPLLNGKIILFGSHDGSVYAVGTERACTFEEPGSDYILGYKEVYLKGKAFSEYGVPSVSIRLNGGEWTNVEVKNSNWNYLIDPNQLQFGIIKIECRVTDASGSESVPYTLLSLIRSEDLPLEKFYLILPSSVNIGQEFTVIIRDETDKPVNNMQLTFEGKTYDVNEEIKLVANRGGILTILAEKQGFETYETSITVKQSSEMNTIYLVIGVLVLILVIYFVYKKFFGKKLVAQE